VPAAEPDLTAVIHALLAAIRSSGVGRRATAERCRHRGAPTRHPHRRPTLRRSAAALLSTSCNCRQTANFLNHLPRTIVEGIGRDGNSGSFRLFESLFTVALGPPNVCPYPYSLRIRSRDEASDGNVEGPRKPGTLVGAGLIIEDMNNTSRSRHRQRRSDTCLHRVGARSDFRSSNNAAQGQA